MSDQHTSGRHSRLATGVCGLVLVAALAGCSENPEPAPLENDTTAASTTPSPSPSKTRSPDGAPIMPPEAKGTSKQAAIAFVEHVIEILNYTARTLDPDALRRVSDPDCQVCDAIGERMRDIQDAGGSISGGEWRSVESRVYMGAGPQLVQVQAVVDSARQMVRRSKDEEPVVHPAGRRVYIFNIAPADTGWTLIDIKADVT